MARISSHLLWLGAMVMDAGALSMFLWTFRERENLYDIFDKMAGVRFTVSHSRIGGVAFDISDDVITEIREWNNKFKKEVADWRKLLGGKPDLGQQK